MAIRERNNNSSSERIKYKITERFIRHQNSPQKGNKRKGVAAGSDKKIYRGGSLPFCTVEHKAKNGKSKIFFILIDKLNLSGEFTRENKR